MKDGQQTKVGVVADDPLRRVGLQTILEENSGLLTRAAHLDEALAAKDLTAALLDSVRLENVLETLARFRRERPELKVVVVGADLDMDRIQAVIAAGAKGYLAGSATEEEVRMAMQVVLDGSIWAPRKVLARLIEAGGVAGTAEGMAERFSDQMTVREMEVLQLLMDGRTNRQIAESMGIEAVTVKAHMGRMLRKAGVKNRIELTLKAMAESPERFDLRRPGSEA